MSKNTTKNTMGSDSGGHAALKGMGLARYSAGPFV